MAIRILYCLGRWSWWINQIVLGPTADTFINRDDCLLLLIEFYLLFIGWSHKVKWKSVDFVAGAWDLCFCPYSWKRGFPLFLLLADNPISQFLNGNTVAFVLYGMIMAGIFEEWSRYIVLKYIMKNTAMQFCMELGTEPLKFCCPSINSALLSDATSLRMGCEFCANRITCY